MKCKYRHTQNNNKISHIHDSKTHSVKHGAPRGIRKKSIKLLLIVNLYFKLLQCEFRTAATEKSSVSSPESNKGICVWHSCSLSLSSTQVFHTRK